MSIKMMGGRLAAGLLGGLGIMFGSLVPAQAAVVTVDASNSYQDVGLVSGRDGQVNPFNIGTAGSYEVRLTDFAFPADPFATLRLIVTSATEEFGRLDAPGSFLFTADPGQYFVSLVWLTSIEGFDMGLYGVEISSSGIPASVVPVPSSVIMLMSAIGVLAFLRYHRSRKAYDTDAREPLAAGVA